MASDAAVEGSVTRWLVNLRDRSVEVHRHAVPAERRSAEVRRARPGDALDLVAFPGATLDVVEMFPPG